MYRILACLLFSFLIAVPCAAAVLDVEAENVQKQGQRVEAFGNVIISGQDITLKSNYVVYDTLTEDIWAAGNVFLKEKGGEITAESLYYNTKRKDVRLEQGSIFVYAEPVIISGKSITRYGEDEYEGDDIVFTPCLGDKPAWSIAAGSFEAPLEKYGHAAHARFQIRDLPIFYLPYLYFPVKLQRQSGLLMPSFSNSTDYGYRAGVPLYLVLGRSADATVTPMNLSSRGLLLTGEFRYRLSEQEDGGLYLEGLMSDKKSGEELPGSVLGTIPDSRWLFRAYQAGGNLTWDVKLASNPDYFRDIGSFYADEAVWRDFYTNEPDDDLEELVSRAQWNVQRKGFTANISGIWTQDLTAQNDDRTLQELPRIALRTNQRKISKTPVFITSELNSVHIYSLDWVQALKNDAQVGFSLPLSYFPFFTLMPSFTQYYRDTYINDNPDLFQSDAIRNLWENRDSSLTSLYNSQFFGDNPGILEDDTYRELWQRREVSLTTTLYSQRFLGGLYHQIAPSISWTHFSRVGGNYDPGDVEDVFPEFLPEDDWNKEFQMRIAIENYIRNSSGWPLADFSLSRVYDYLIREWDYYEANIVLQPVPWFTARHFNRFGREPHPYATIEHWSRLTVRDARDDELYAAEEYNKVDTKSALMGMKVNLVKGLSARFELEYDFLDDRVENSRQALTYTAQCWSVDFYREVEPSEDSTPRETTIGVAANLLGIGQVVRTKRSMTGSSGQ